MAQSASRTWRSWSTPPQSFVREADLAVDAPIRMAVTRDAVTSLAAPDATTALPTSPVTGRPMRAQPIR